MNTVKIEVVDENGNPIKDAKVVVLTGEGSGKPYFTDENGICKVKLPFTLGFVKIEVVKEGYERQAEELYCQTTFRKIILRKERKVVEKREVVKEAPKPIFDFNISKPQKELPSKRKVTIHIYDEEKKPIGDLILITSAGELKVEKGICTLEVEGKEDIEVIDPYGVYKSVSLSLDGREIELTLQISDSISNFDFTKTRDAMDEFEKAVSRFNSNAYDQEVLEYLKHLCFALVKLGDAVKKNPGTLRGRFNVLELMKELDETSAEVIRGVKDILTSREGMYLLYDIKRFKGDVVEEKVDVAGMIDRIVKRALELEAEGVIKGEVGRLSLEVDREITEAMREGINGFFFSSLYKVHKKLGDRAYAVQFLLLSVVKLMLNVNSIRAKLKGLTG